MDSVIALTFLAGGTTLVVALVLQHLWQALPPRSVCPCCRAQTEAVSHALSAHTDRWVRRRWCSACGWEGWGRNGPVLWRRRGPVSHGSGFRWGPDRLEMDFGFRWAAHPAPEAEPFTLVAAPAHPSGFRWAGRVEEPLLTAAHPSGFLWADDSRPDRRTPQAAGSFQWKS